MGIARYILILFLTMMDEIYNSKLFKKYFRKVLKVMNRKKGDQYT